jgi:predicted DNA-binding transcriptional regulator AlpA
MGDKQSLPTAKRVVQEKPLPGENAVPSLIFTAAEASALFHKSARTWRTWDSSGKIPRPIRIGRSTYWRPEELQAWVAAGCPDRETWELSNRDHEASDCRDKSGKNRR